MDPKTLQADVWVFDPVNLAKPWYTRQSWTKLTNDDYLLRIRYWDCRENSNNDIVVTDEGTSQFPDFDFVGDDAAVSSDAAREEGRGRGCALTRARAVANKGGDGKVTTGGFEAEGPSTLRRDSSALQQRSQSADVGQRFER